MTTTTRLRTTFGKMLKWVLVHLTDLKKRKLILQVIICNIQMTNQFIIQFPLMSLQNQKI